MNIFNKQKLYWISISLVNYKCAIIASCFLPICIIECQIAAKSTEAIQTTTMHPLVSGGTGGNENHYYQLFLLQYNHCEKHLL